MTSRRLLLLLGFGREETKMASVRWKRFCKHLAGGPFSFEWVPIKLPYCEDSASTAAKAIREVSVFRQAKRHARQLASSQDPQIKTTILASIPTLDPLYVGAILRRTRKANTELVLEIRDIYARPELFEYNSARRRLEVLKESMLIRRVDRFIFLTEEIKRRYRQYYPRLSSIRDGAVITNGYDPEEYGLLPTAASRPDSLEIGYFGSFYASRNPELLFQGLTLLRKDGGEIAKVRIHIWGEAGNYPLQARIAEYGLQENVLYHGIAPHERIIKEYPAAGVNLIITHTAGSSYALPGKLFEYMGAARPVWAITDDEILRDFITGHKLGYLSVHTAESIAGTLRSIVQDHARAGGLPGIGRVADFEIGALTRRLENFLLDGEHAAN
ncbi:MAG: glycosyltransferase [Solirubrobacterales bacterium]